MGPKGSQECDSGAPLRHLPSAAAVQAGLAAMPLNEGTETAAKSQQNAKHNPNT